jgi:hypothetical protein
MPLVAPLQPLLHQSPRLHPSTLDQPDAIGFMHNVAKAYLAQAHPSHHKLQSPVSDAG